MSRWPGVLVAALIAFAVPEAGAQEPPSIPELVRQLGDEDAAVRDRADRAIEERGEGALEALRAELAKDDGSDGERAMRLRRCVERIEEQMRWTRLWKEAPADLVREHLRSETCGLCGNKKPWDVVAVSDASLERRFPGCRFFILDWICCQDRPVSSRVLAVGNRAGAMFDIDLPATFIERLQPFIAPQRTAAEAVETADALMSLLDARGFESEFKLKGGGRAVESGDGGWRVYNESRRPKWMTVFDKDGKLTDVGYQPGR